MVSPERTRGRYAARPDLPPPRHLRRSSLPGTRGLGSSPALIGRAAALLGMLDRRALRPEPTPRRRPIDGLSPGFASPVWGIAPGGVFERIGPRSSQAPKVVRDGPFPPLAGWHLQCSSGAQAVNDGTWILWAGSPRSTGRPGSRRHDFAGTNYLDLVKTGYRVVPMKRGRSGEAGAAGWHRRGRGRRNAAARRADRFSRKARRLGHAAASEVPRMRAHVGRTPVLSGRPGVLA